MITRLLNIFLVLVFSFECKAPAYASSYTEALADKEARLGKQDSFADKSYYLVDSLDLKSLRPSDIDILDSALTSYHDSEDDTGRLKSLSIICEAMMDNSWHKYQYLQHDMINELIAAGKPIIQENIFKILQASALNNIGYIHMNKGEYSEAMEYYEQSLELKKVINDEMGVAGTLNNIGLIYDYQGDIENALKYYHMSLAIKEKIGDKRGIAYSFNNLGVIYAKHGDHEKALDFYNRSLSIRKEIVFKNGISESLRNIAVTYEKIGKSAKALEFLKKSLKIDIEIGEKSGIVHALNNIGVIYEQDGRIDSALQYFEKCITISEEIGEKRLIALSLAHMADLLANNSEDDDLAVPRQYAERSLAIAREIGSPSSVQYCALVLHRIFKIEGNFEKALEMYELHIQMRDSVNNEKTHKATIRQQTKYEFEKAALIKEQEEKEAARLVAEETSRRDNLQYSIILLGLLVLGILILGLGKLSLSTRMAEGLIFFSFLILFEFILVLADPYIDTWSSGAPGIKLLFNAGIAALIFPLHAFFETTLKKRLTR